MNANNTSPQQLSAAAMAALQRGNKIDAIKLARQETGLGLKEAKDVIDAYIASNPALQEQATHAIARWLARLDFHDHRGVGCDRLFLPRR